MGSQLKLGLGLLLSMLVAVHAASSGSYLIGVGGSFRDPHTLPAPEFEGFQH